MSYPQLQGMSPQGQIMLFNYIYLREIMGSRDMNPRIVPISYYKSHNIPNLCTPVDLGYTFPP